jgi:phage gp36-like protein
VTYAQPSDLVARFGQVEINQLSDPDQTGAPVASYVTQALTDATVVIDGYLYSRYRDVMPFQTQPEPLTKYCCDIARYNLYTGGNKRPTDEVTKLYDAAIRWLELIQRGQLTLGLPDPMPEEGGLVEGSDILVAGDRRLFKRRSW